MGSRASLDDFKERQSSVLIIDRNPIFQFPIYDLFAILNILSRLVLKIITKIKTEFFLKLFSVIIFSKINITGEHIKHYN